MTSWLPSPSVCVKDAAIINAFMGLMSLPKTASQPSPYNRLFSPQPQQGGNTPLPPQRGEMMVYKSSSRPSGWNDGNYYSKQGVQVVIDGDKGIRATAWEEYGINGSPAINFMTQMTMGQWTGGGGGGRSSNSTTAQACFPNVHISWMM